MGFMAATKVWNAHHKMVNTKHVWAVPRKGTSEHAEVKRIMAGEEAHQVIVAPKPKSPMTEQQQILKDALLASAALKTEDASPRHEIKDYPGEDKREFDFKGITLLQGVDSGNIYIHGVASVYEDEDGNPIDEDENPIEPSDMFIGNAGKGRFRDVEHITPLDEQDKKYGFRTKKALKPVVNAPPALLRASISAMPLSPREAFKVRLAELLENKEGKEVEGYDDEELYQFKFNGTELSQGEKSGNIYVLDDEWVNRFIGNAGKGRFKDVKRLTDEPEPVVNAPPALLRASISAIPLAAKKTVEAALKDPEFVSLMSSILQDTKPVKKRK
jgi:hypothetical protein